MYIAVEPVRDFVRILQQDVVLLLENTLQADQFDLLFFHNFSWFNVSLDN